MKIVQSIMTECPCYRAYQKINVTHLVLHSTGVSQPKASAYINQFKQPTYIRASCHAFIDGNTGIVYQTLPWDINGWHVGGSANNYSIGVEMCEGGNMELVYNVAVELFAYLCKKYNINPLTNIMGHYEAYLSGRGSNHGDPRSYWGNKHNMDTFRVDVNNKLKNPTVNNISHSYVPNNHDSNVSKHEIVVECTADTLNRRKEPSLHSSIVGTQHRGYQNRIVEKRYNDGMWWFKDVAGYWISSNYCKDVIYTCKVNELNRRSEPSLNSDVVGVDHNGNAHRIKQYKVADGIKWAQDIAGYWFSTVDRYMIKSLDNCKLNI